MKTVLSVNRQIFSFYKKKTMRRKRVIDKKRFCAFYNTQNNGAQFRPVYIFCKYVLEQKFFKCIDFPSSTYL
jgi:ribosomal protein L19E